MPFTSAALPFKPDHNATISEMKECVGASIEWALSLRLSQLKAAGVIDSDSMQLRRAAVNRLKGRAGYKGVRVIWELMAR